MINLCYVLSYYDPRYIRTLSLLNALAQLPGVKVYVAINQNKGLWRYVDTLSQVWRIKQLYHIDCYLLGFRGLEILMPLRWIIGQKPLIFDSLMSPHAALRDDRKFGWLGGWFSFPLYYIEKLILRQADSVLTDTESHVKFLAERFKINCSRIYAVPIGAVGRLPKNFDYLEPSDKKFNVLFYGSFLPLHGLPIILRAANLLRNLPIFFTFIGGVGSSLRRFHHLCQSLQLQNFQHFKWINFDSLLDEYIAGADLCLGGPFGDTPQARRIVTGKAVQCLAMQKVTVIGDIAENFGFIDKFNCLLVKQGDVDNLALAIKWAYLNQDQLAMIGKKGRELYEERFSPLCIASKLKLVLAGLSRLHAETIEI